MTEQHVSTHVVAGADGPQRLSFNQFTLEVVSGPNAGSRQTFGQSSVQIGTARANDMVLTDRTVSRLHLRIDTDGGTFRVVDLDSTNGTRVGGLRIQAAYLDAPVNLALGTTTISFQPHAERTEVELPAQHQLGALVGRSSKMRALYMLITRVAPSDLAVIIEGETGTGKELVARSIHDHSPRVDKPFEVLDCSAIPAQLVESELFGHVKGAFTGAERDHPGVFERANGGTVFLDEIGELDLNMQPKLLRVLQSHEFRRVGDTKTRRCDVRLVAATHRSLGALVNEGAFREDLYFRIAGCRLELPPLRARLDDIPLLVEHFMSKLRVRASKLPLLEPDAEALAGFAEQPWPGNVRQLRNAVERLAIMGSSDVSVSPASEPSIEPASLEQAAALTTRMPLREAKDAFERCYLEALIRQHGGDVPGAAEAAEIHAKSLHRMLRRHAIRRA